ncbi:MAG: D-glycero-beta-D-manno-heptose 1,7-bisphosphate 7-phosphatase [Pseudomonadota bacterium]
MKLVVLDRDGVINRDSPEYVKSAREFVPLPGSLEAIGRLVEGGWTVTIASNQSGVGRGLFTLENLADMQAKLQAELVAFGGHIEGFFYCPHTPRSHCDCRKPKDGLLRQIGERFNTAMQGVPVIGDSLRDLEAAWSVDARAMLVMTGNGKRTRAELDDGEFPETETYASLGDAADALLSAEEAPA